MISPQQLEQLERRLEAKLASMIQRVTVSLVDDAKKLQSVQVQGLSDETGDGSERFQGYGLSFNPPDGSEGIGLSPGGQREGLFVILLEDRSVRPTGAGKGEGGLYNQSGWLVFLKADDTLRLGGNDADKPNVLGDLMKTAIETMWDDIQSAVGKIAATGIDHTASQLEFTTKKATLAQNLTAALSQKVFGK